MDGGCAHLELNKGPLRLYEAGRDYHREDDFVCVAFVHVIADAAIIEGFLARRRLQKHDFIKLGRELRMHGVERVFAKRHRHMKEWRLDRYMMYAERMFGHEQV